MEPPETSKSREQLQQTFNQPTAISQLQTIEITHSPLGNKLQKPIVLELPKPRSAGERNLREYVINAFSWKMPALISFTLYNNAVLELAKHLLRHCTGSTATLYQYVYGVHRFCRWLQRTPNQLIAECRGPEGEPIPKTLAKHVKLLDDFIGELQAQGLAPGTISNHVKGVKALYRANQLALDLPYRLTRRVIYKDRAPKPEELQHLIDLADLREKVIISTLALGAFRIGTLCKLRYRHVRKDLERGIIPLHIHVEAEITKGKYGDYDTFLGEEAVEYLKMYLAERRMGSRRGWIPPEEIHDESPLIRDEKSVTVKPLTPGRIHSILHTLYKRAGLIRNKKSRRYKLRAHSIRKFFRTQMAALGVNTDYIEYMMGHKISSYHDVQMKGIEFLRNVYAASGLSIKPKTRVSKIDALKEIIRAWGMNPEQILAKEALSQPHRTYTTPHEREEHQVKTLALALKETIKKELLAEKV
ncbi:MAG: site-specific integrase [Thermoproteota archaeon]|nr:site-specific integrase [Thermoproteota archaeon]